MKEQLKDQTLYGFWSYDLCPYILGAEIEGFTNIGNIIPKGYQGSFYPIAILPDEAGQEALKKLRKLWEDYFEIKIQMNLKYKNAARELVGIPKVEK